MGARLVAGCKGGDGVAHGGGGGDLAAVDVQGAEQGNDNDATRGQHKLKAGAKQGGEELEVRWAAKDVTVDELPARFVVCCKGLVLQLLAKVLVVVLVQGAHEDERHEAREEGDQAKGVDEGEGMDLVLKEAGGGGGG